MSNRPLSAYASKPITIYIVLLQYTSLAFTEALIESGIAGSVGSVGDALDNALMESTIGLYKTELIDRQKSWTGRSEVERETASWVHWFNTTRLHSSIGYPIAHRLRKRVPSTTLDSHLRPRRGLNQVSIRSRVVHVVLPIPLCLRVIRCHLCLPHSRASDDRHRTKQRWWHEPCKTESSHSTTSDPCGGLAYSSEQPSKPQQRHSTACEHRRVGTEVCVQTRRSARGSRHGR
jgi:hypothetical protein